MEVRGVIPGAGGTAVVSHLTLVLGAELGPLGEQDVVLPTEPSLQLLT